LEIMANGLRFISTKGEKVDVSFKNIKHAFFQKCEKDLIVLIHLHLAEFIMIGNKKSKDVQFYREIGAMADDIGGNRKRKGNERDELEEEERERQ
jgi:nucleosome binding factor SPN SPT16 subunit